MSALLIQVLHAALLLAAAPLVVGLVRWLKARLLGRRGASPMQPWRDLAKLLRKRPVVAEGASVVTLAAPYVAVGATMVAMLLVPSFARGMALGPVADLLVLAGLLALARAALALAGMDAGTAFGGLGAAREMAFATFAEPALLVVALCCAILAGSSNLDTIAATFAEGGLGLRVSLALALASLAAVALAEAGRIPVDNPATHLELTMVHEAMILEASGRHLALWEYQAALLLTLWLTLLAALFAPIGMAPAGAGPVAWVLGLLAFTAKIGVLALALAIFECASAKMRIFRVPEFLGAALLLGLLGALFLFVSIGLL